MSGNLMTVVRPGLQSTVQDLGRWGHQAWGVPVAGPMDVFSHRVANALVGNPDDAATLEVTLIGPELAVERPARVAVAGAIFDLALDGTPVPPHRTLDVPAGGRVSFGTRRAGARAYVAVAGGLATPPVLGSRATHLPSAMGGVEGRALRAGDVLPIGSNAAAARRLVAAAPSFLPGRGQARLRVLAGPQEAWFGAQAHEALAAGAFMVATASNRMAYTLDGPPLPAARRGELLSEPVPFGAIQVPPGGAPLLLMADRQTAGGYLKIATVILADLPIAGQLAPGDLVTLTVCSRAEAMRALIERERELLRATRGAAVS